MPWSNQSGGGGGWKGAAETAVPGAAAVAAIMADRGVPAPIAMVAEIP